MPSARPTVFDVARHAGVSHQTVSNALNAPHRLRPATLDRVLLSVQALGYRPNEAARSMRSQRSMLLGFRLGRSVAPSTRSMEDRFLHEISTAAQKRGYGVVVFTAEDDTEEIATYAELTSREAVDGFIVMNTHRGDIRPGWLAEHTMPFVCFGRPWERASREYSWIDVDGRRGLRLATEHCAQEGHRRIGFIGWPSGTGVGDDRYAGWRDATAALKLPTRGLVARGPESLTAGNRLAAQLLTSARPPTALVCVTDLFAVGAMQAIEGLGLKVGHDVAVVGFDDGPLATALTPALSSVRQPLELIAARCLDLVLRSIQRPQRSASNSILEPELIVRASSKPSREVPDEGQLA